jgi:HPt (histidine-containing phosphotransfer) domain-containing protein
MIPLTTSEGLAAKGSHLSSGAWSPPELLLEAAGDDDALIAKLIEAFIRDTGTRMQQMRGALASSSFTNIRAEAHTVKGSARQMGADAVGDACQELENACALRDELLIAAQVRRLQELFDAVKTAMIGYSNRSRDTLI